MAIDSFLPASLQQRPNSWQRKEIAPSHSANGIERPSEGDVPHRQQAHGSAAGLEMAAKTARLVVQMCNRQNVRFRDQVDVWPTYEKYTNYFSEYDRRPHKRKTVYTAEEIRAIKQDVEEVRRELLAGYGDRDFFGQPASAVLPQSANHTAHISSASADSLLPRRRVNELGETQRLYGVHLRDSISDLAGICRLARKLSEQANRHAHGDVAMETLSFEGSEGDSDASSNEELMFGKSESAPDFETLMRKYMSAEDDSGAMGEARETLALPIPALRRHNSLKTARTSSFFLEEQALASVAVGRLVRRHSSLRSSNKRTTNEIASNTHSPEQSANRRPRMRHSSESELDMQRPMGGIAEHQLGVSTDLNGEYDGWHVFVAAPNQVPDIVVAGESPPRPSSLNAAA